MLLVGGENLIDFIQVDGDGGNPIYQANPGGSPYNCAKAMARQQVPVSYLTPISTDSLGVLLASGLTDSGVILCGEQRHEPSSLAVVSLDNGIASYQFYRQQTAERMVTLTGLQSAVPGGTKAFHLGSLSITGGEDADVWADFYIGLKQQGIFTSLDPNIRAPFITDRPAFLARLDRLLAATDLLKLSDDDLEWIYPGMNLEEAAQKMLSQSRAKLLVLTLGGDGALAFSNGEKIAVKPAKVNGMKDTVGAGDTFMATLLAGLEQSGKLNTIALGNLTESDVTSLLGRAAAAAALNCEKTGCNPPDQDTINTRLAES